LAVANRLSTPAQIRLEVLKRSFSSRSEAGRYAANMRWQGHTSAGSSSDIKGLVDRTVAGKKSRVTAKDFGKVLDAMADREDNPDITKLSIIGTRLMSDDNLGIARRDMPQIPSNRRQEFIDLLESRGVKVTRETEFASSLKPIQSEISGSNSGQIMRKMENRKGKYSGDFDDFDKSAIVISSDGYVIDGHHRWAAYLAREFKGTGGKANVIRLGMNHQEAIATTRAWNAATGIKGLELGQNNPTDLNVAKMALVYKMADLAAARHEKENANG
jgi:hypothetical protein